MRRNWLRCKFWIPTEQAGDCTGMIIAAGHRRRLEVLIDHGCRRHSNLTQSTNPSRSFDPLPDLEIIYEHLK